MIRNTNLLHELTIKLDLDLFEVISRQLNVCETGLNPEVPQLQNRLIPNIFIGLEAGYVANSLLL